MMLKIRSNYMNEIIYEISPEKYDGESSTLRNYGIFKAVRIQNDPYWTEKRDGKMVVVDEATQEMYNRVAWHPHFTSA